MPTSKERWWKEQLLLMGQKYPCAVLTKGCHENDELNEVLNHVESTTIDRCIEMVKSQMVGGTPQNRNTIKVKNLTNVKIHEIAYSLESLKGKE